MDKKAPGKEAIGQPGATIVTSDTKKIFTAFALVVAGWSDVRHGDVPRVNR